jgi:bacterioferritin
MKNQNNTEIIGLLQSALADEWLAHYQYWVGAKIAVGPLRPSIAAEFEEHAKQEHEHASKLADRIIQLGGALLLHPNQWLTKSSCGYQEPSVPHVIKLLEQNIQGEKMAIEAYLKMIAAAEKIDPITYFLAVDILKEEEEHKVDLQSLLDDIQAEHCCKK